MASFEEINIIRSDLDFFWRNKYYKEAITCCKYVTKSYNC